MHIHLLKDDIIDMLDLTQKYNSANIGLLSKHTYIHTYRLLHDITYKFVTQTMSVGRIGGAGSH